jgi:hypothetical protein
MGDKGFFTAIEDDVPFADIGRGQRLYGDHLTIANGGLHAFSRGWKAHPLSAHQELSDYRSKVMRME